MRLSLRLCAAPLALAALSPPAAAQARCEGVTLPQYAICRATPHGLVFAGTADDVEWGAAVALRVEAQFSRHFGAVPRYALLIKDGETRYPPELERAGYHRYLIWKSPRSWAAQMRDLQRPLVQKNFQEQGVVEPELTARTERALERVFQREFAGGASIAAHELGHNLLESFWNGKPPPVPAPRARYGTLAPDWLDEVAAILMESEESLENRRRFLPDLHKGGKMVPLRIYLGMPHPVGGVSEPAAAGAGGGPQVGPLEYYSQSLGFAEFLAETSGRPRIFEAIARKLSDGSTFEQWLAAEGRDYNLAADLDSLNRMWEAWLQRRYGAAADRAPNATN